MERYTLLRKQRKTLTLRLDKDGNITVSAPLRMPQTEIDKFVSEHSDWIKRKRRELSARNPLPSVAMKEGEKIPLFGREYLLKFRNNRCVAVEENSIFLPYNNAKSALIRYYRRQLRECVAPMITRYSRKLRVTPAKVSVGSARTRWGSCSGKNSLNFSFRLAMCDISAVEYVVVHELCHILYKNHSKIFWSEVGRYFPDYKQAKLYLRRKAYFMEII